MRRLAVNQTPMRHHRLKLMWKTLKRVKLIQYINSILITMKSYILLSQLKLKETELFSFFQFYYVVSTWTLLENRKLWNMKMTFIQIVIDAFVTVTKGILKGLEDLEIRGRVETTQPITLLGTARILKRVLET